MLTRSIPAVGIATDKFKATSARACRLLKYGKDRRRTLYVVKYEKMESIYDCGNFF